MPDRRYRILSTRQLEAGLIAAAALQGIDIETKTFIHIQPVVNKALQERIQALLQQDACVIFTSANAVSAIAPNGAALPAAWRIACLEGATLQAVKQALPAAHIIATAPNAAALAAQVLKLENTPSVVFCCGNQRRDELPDILRAHHILVEELVVYETVPATVVTTANYDGLLFFSPSAVNSYFAHNSPNAGAVCFAIGGTTAAALEAHTHNTIITSPAPDAGQLVQTVINYFNNINSQE